MHLCFQTAAAAMGPLAGVLKPEALEGCEAVAAGADVASAADVGAPGALVLSTAAAAMGPLAIVAKPEALEGCAAVAAVGSAVGACSNREP